MDVFSNINMFRCACGVRGCLQNAEDKHVLCFCFKLCFAIAVLQLCFAIVFCKLCFAICTANVFCNCVFLSLPHRDRLACHIATT